MEIADDIRDTLDASGLGAFFRRRDFEAAGFTAHELNRLVEAGHIEHISRGLYHWADAEVTEHYTLAAVAAYVPEAVFCLLTALSYHEIGTQLPGAVWVGLATGRREPGQSPFRLRVMRFAGAELSYGVEEVRLEGVPARITNPARTVVDAFRYLDIVGRDVAIEALRDALRERKTTPAQVWRTAEVLRSEALVEPYLYVLTQ